MTKRKIEYWVIPPEQDAEFVACREEVLETYAKPMTLSIPYCVWKTPECRANMYCTRLCIGT